MKQDWNIPLKKAIGLCDKDPAQHSHPHTSPLCDVLQRATVSLEKRDVGLRKQQTRET